MVKCPCVQHLIWADLLLKNEGNFPKEINTASQCISAAVVTLSSLFWPTLDIVKFCRHTHYPTFVLLQASWFLEIKYETLFPFLSQQVFAYLAWSGKVNHGAVIALYVVTCFASNQWNGKPNSFLFQWWLHTVAFLQVSVPTNDCI